MLPLLGLLYAVALIDRTNLGIARIAGMEKDLVRQFVLPSDDLPIIGLLGTVYWCKIQYCFLHLLCAIHSLVSITLIS
jgi:hypothetical protein